MPETIRLYGFWRSAATYRVRIALALKGLAFEETSLDLLAGEQFRQDFNAHNPQNAVPVLIDGEAHLSQSLAIIEYLEERTPEPTLFPQDPIARATARSFALITIADSHPFHVPRVRKQLASQFGASETDFYAWAQHWQNQALQAMETILAKRQHVPHFCFTDQPGIADIGLASQVASARIFDIQTNAYPIATTIFERCLELEAFAHHSPQALQPTN